jgi:hypothetical protein
MNEIGNLHSFKAPEKDLTTKGRLALVVFIKDYNTSYGELGRSIIDYDHTRPVNGNRCLLRPSRSGDTTAVVLRASALMMLIDVGGFRF